MSDFLKAVPVAIKALDTLIDENYHRQPLKEQQEMSYNYRNVGLGVLGYATALMKMGIKYGSNEAIQFTDELFHFMFKSAVSASNNLAKEKGSFPKYSDRVWDSEIIKRHFSQDEIAYMKPYGLRNCSLLSVAPTGSLAPMVNESGGCEPEYAISYTRRTVGLTKGEDSYYKVYCKAATEYMKMWNTDTLPDYFVGASDIPYLDRIKAQSAMQEHVDTAISSTINLPNSATKEDIASIYLKSWQYGLKGITIFRDGCQKAGILTTENTPVPKTTTDNRIIFDSITPISRKTMGTTHGNTYCKKCACGTLYITLNRDQDGHIVESFIHTSKGGICQAHAAAVNRMTSLALRSGVKVSEIVDQLRGINCPACSNVSAKGTKLDGMSCPDILARTLEEFASAELALINNGNHQETSTTPKCPECGAPIVHEGGCVKCLSCGWGKCEG